MIKFKFDKKAGEEQENYITVWLYPGSGAGLYGFATVADNEEEALENVADYLVEKQLHSFYMTPQEYQDFMKDFYDDLSEEELEEKMENNETVMYVDTGRGAVVYLTGFENAKIEKGINESYIDDIAIIDGSRAKGGPLSKWSKKSSKKVKANTSNFATQEGYPLIAIGDEQVYPKEIFVEEWNANNPDEPIKEWDEEDDTYSSWLDDNYIETANIMKDYLKSANIPYGWDIDIENGYYEGIQLWVEEPKDFEYDFENNWLYDNELEESDLTPEQKAELQNAMQAQYEKEKAQVIQIMHDAAKACGWLELAVAYRFSNGETGYSVVKSGLNKKAEEKETLKIKFVGIDDWNRPIFKPLDKNYYLSDVNNLFDYGTDEKTIKEFYAEMPFPLNKYITYHGRSFDSEPYGSEIEEELEIV